MRTRSAAAAASGTSSAGASRTRSGFLDELGIRWEGREDSL